MQAPDAGAVVGVDEVGGTVLVDGAVVGEVLVGAVDFFGLPLELQLETKSPTTMATPIMVERAAQFLELRFSIREVLT